MADPEPLDTVVLVADDDDLVRTVLGLALASRGLAVVESADVDGTRRAGKAHTLELAVLDVNMPGGTLRDSLDAVRTSHPRLPVLVLSGEPTRPDDLDDVDVEFARKPIDLDDFLERVDRLLDPARNEPRP
ncbi:MAG: response regulator [Microcella sp.]|uniref:response regulator n=1 Tax=Microcella sp. TaxID=1913979 RepID=UPI003315F055